MLSFLFARLPSGSACGAIWRALTSIATHAGPKSAIHGCTRRQPYSPKAHWISYHSFAASAWVRRFLASDWALLSSARLEFSANWGMAIAARIPMMASTMSNSISVKPQVFFKRRFLFVELGPCQGQVWIAIATNRRLTIAMISSTSIWDTPCNDLHHPLPNRM